MGETKPKGPLEAVGLNDFLVRGLKENGIEVEVMGAQVLFDTSKVYLATVSPDSKITSSQISNLPMGSKIDLVSRSTVGLDDSITTFHVTEAGAKKKYVFASKPWSDIPEGFHPLAK